MLRLACDAPPLLSRALVHAQRGLQLSLLHPLRPAQQQQQQQLLWQLLLCLPRLPRAVQLQLMHASQSPSVASLASHRL
jgi:hypothetical protein